MKKTTRMFFAGLALAALMMGSACSQRYALQGIERTQMVVDSRYDAVPDEAAHRLLAPYRQRVDSVMGPVVGSVATDMSAYRPESALSNLLADILIWGGKAYGEQPVFAVYNMGGIRASLSKGEVTFGDIVDVAPFENKICFMTLTGRQLAALCQQIARRGGEGVSHGMRMEITRDGQLVKATLHGHPIEPEGKYRIATIDYLAEGNDHLGALRDGTERVLPQAESNNLRYIIRDYFLEHQARGEVVTAQVEGRVILQP